MKKTYMQPVTMLTKVNVEQMICTSGLEVAGTTNSEDDLLSRESYPRFSLWDDDEE